MGPVEIVEEFHRGCVNTIVTGAHPGTCAECLGIAKTLLVQQGLSPVEAHRLLTYGMEKGARYA